MQQRLLPALALAGLAALAACHETDAPPPVNLLFLLSDQHRGSALGCAGHPLVQTPNLDRLAAAGVRFTNAIVQVPLCVPSRASLLSGTYPQIHRATHNDSSLPPEQLTWPELLRERGYRTLAVGRVHGVYDGFEMLRVPGKQAAHDLAEEVLRGPAAGELRMPRDEHWDTRITDVALEQLALLERADQPWALYVGFLSPHPPLAPPAPYDRMYSPADVEVPSLDLEQLASQPSWHRNTNGSAAIDGEHRRQRTARYLGLVTHLDHEIGRLLEGLEALGLTKDTLVVYTSDHGSPLGAHGITRKNVSFFETDVNVPLILSLPGRLPAGRVVEQPVESIDLAPTLLELLGQSSAPEFLGSDLGPLIRGTGQRARPYTFASIDLLHSMAPLERGLMIRDKHWKYVWYTSGEGELYDLRADPEEQSNLFTEPEWAAVRERHAATLLEHLVWLWTLVPGRELTREFDAKRRLGSAAPGRCALVTRTGRTGAVLRRGEWELEVFLGGGRALLGPEGPDAADHYGDPQYSSLRQALEASFVHQLAFGIGRAHPRGEDSELCID